MLRSPVSTPALASSERPDGRCYGQAFHYPVALPLVPASSSSSGSCMDVDEVCCALLAELLSVDSQSAHSPSTAATLEEQLSIQEIQEILRQCVAEADGGGQAAHLSSPRRDSAATVATPAATGHACCPQPAQSGHATPTSSIRMRRCDRACGDETVSSLW